VTFAHLGGEPILLRTYCEHCAPLVELLRSHKLDVDRAHELSSDNDLALFLEHGLGMAFVPRSASFAASLTRAAVEGLDLRRTVFLYAVAGRQRTPVANMIMKMLRGADWSRYAR